MPTTNEVIDSTQSSVHMDAIRGLAAVVVMLGHTRELFFPSLTGARHDQSYTSTNPSSAALSPMPAKSGLTIGNEVVMIFFVLSGYLVGGGVLKAVRRGTWSWQSYLIKRMTRLWVVLIPALFLGVALDCAGLYFFPPSTSIYGSPAQQQVVHDLTNTLSIRVILGNCIFLQSLVVKTAGTNDSLWSLANEFWYYMAFPIILLALRQHQKRIVRAIYLLAFALIILLLGWHASLLFLIWLLGALLSLVPRIVTIKTAKIASLAMAILLPLVIVAAKRAPLSTYQAECVVAIYFTGLLYLILHQVEKAANNSYKRASSFLSRISYTLYLVHLPIAVLLCACINNPWHQLTMSPKNVSIYIAMDVVVVLASYVFYLLFEANTDKVRDALFRQPEVERRLPTS